jgi:hypothetical protein
MDSPLKARRPSLARTGELTPSLLAVAPARVVLMAICQTTAQLRVETSFGVSAGFRVRPGAQTLPLPAGASIDRTIALVLLVHCASGPSELSGARIAGQAGVSRVGRSSLQSDRRIQRGTAAHDAGAVSRRKSSVGTRPPFLPRGAELLASPQTRCSSISRAPSSARSVSGATGRIERRVAVLAGW